ncbi:5251_t:CDS:2 [Acaulospora colombiana]|uniref:5251_t:CDS:1 n=1 Tax=Acaulospora colombiana TaxID=27376 RepID=A0ACA9LL24_9GLOM|nr:5251_t:CDS:2 [Acaulospora colombiana]
MNLKPKKVRNCLGIKQFRPTRLVLGLQRPVYRISVVVATSPLRDILQPGRPGSTPPLIDAERCLAARSDNVGPLTSAFKDLLFQMWEGEREVVSPRDLFDQITRKWSQFRGWRQQDSQELMRFLFDGIKSEELECSYSYEDFLDVSLPIKSPDNNNEDMRRKIRNGVSDFGYNFSQSSGVDFENSGQNGDGMPLVSKEKRKRIKLLLKEVPFGSGRSAKNSSRGRISLVDCLSSFMRNLHPEKSRVHKENKANEDEIDDANSSEEVSSKEDTDPMPGESPETAITEKKLDISKTEESSETKSTQRFEETSRNLKPQDSSDPTLDNVSKETPKDLKPEESMGCTPIEGMLNNSTKTDGSSEVIPMRIEDTLENSKTQESSDPTPEHVSKGTLDKSEEPSNSAPVSETLNNSTKIDESSEATPMQIEDALENYKPQESSNPTPEHVSKETPKNLKPEEFTGCTPIKEMLNSSTKIDESSDPTLDNVSKETPENLKPEESTRCTPIKEMPNSSTKINESSEATPMQIEDAPENSKSQGSSDPTLDNVSKETPKNLKPEEFTGCTPISEMLSSSTKIDEPSEATPMQIEDTSENLKPQESSNPKPGHVSKETLDKSEESLNSAPVAETPKRYKIERSPETASMHFSEEIINNPKSEEPSDTPLTHVSNDAFKVPSKPATTDNSEENIVSEVKSGENSQNEDHSSSTSEDPTQPDAEIDSSAESSSLEHDPKSGGNASQPFILRKAYKRYLFGSLPPVLVFHLKRFQQVGSRWGGVMSMRKIDDFVEFHEELDVDGEKTRNTKYRLYGVVVHLGSLYNGHYIAYVLTKNVLGMGEQFGVPKLNSDDLDAVEKIHLKAEMAGENRQWIYCSDSSVRPASVDDVLNSGAYLLFYEQVR